MEHTLSRKVEVSTHAHEWNAFYPLESDNPQCKICGISRNEAIIKPPSSADTTAGAKVDEKIFDVIRMTVATAAIVLESSGVNPAQISNMRERTLRMLSVKERRNYGS